MGVEWGAVRGGVGEPEAMGIHTLKERSSFVTAHLTRCLRQLTSPCSQL